MQPSSQLEPSATVVLVRDAAGDRKAAGDNNIVGDNKVNGSGAGAAAGVEALLVQRHRDVSVAGGSWVFPGGKVEQGELSQHANIEQAEKCAAVRECLEEAGIALEVEQLQKFAHWITPTEMPRRFSTGFYIVAIDRNVTVQIDRSEIVEYRWLTPQHAIAQQACGELSLLPPTFVSLHELASMESAAAAVAAFAQSQAKTFLPKIVRDAERQGAACVLYQGDSGYASANPNVAGKQHRLLMGGGGYRYICD
ncbi:MAG: NUDIX hydrolase [Gammaproteobacteria bacterium]|nr:NUDIX hydrolase [Gammaproteobacteria bacterium]